MRRQIYRHRLSKTVFPIFLFFSNSVGGGWEFCMGFLFCFFYWGYTFCNFSFSFWLHLIFFLLFVFFFNFSVRNISFNTHIVCMASTKSSKHRIQTNLRWWREPRFIFHMYGAHPATTSKCEDMLKRNGIPFIYVDYPTMISQLTYCRMHRHTCQSAVFDIVLPAFRVHARFHTWPTWKAIEVETRYCHNKHQ